MASPWHPRFTARCSVHSSADGQQIGTDGGRRCCGSGSSILFPRYGPASQPTSIPLSLHAPLGAWVLVFAPLPRRFISQKSLLRKGAAVSPACSSSILFSAFSLHSFPIT